MAIINIVDLSRECKGIIRSDTGAGTKTNKSDKMNKLNMEILVHILDQDGKRTKPSLNRIDSVAGGRVTPKELLFLTPRIECDLVLTS